MSLRKMKRRPMLAKRKTFVFCNAHGHGCDGGTCAGSRMFRVEYFWLQK